MPRFQTMTSSNSGEIRTGGLSGKRNTYRIQAFEAWSAKNVTTARSAPSLTAESLGADGLGADISPVYGVAAGGATGCRCAGTA